MLYHKERIGILVIIVMVGILAWAPWLTDDYAVFRVVEKLGGGDRAYNYLGDLMPLRDVPKSVIRLPFVALVYFPSEAVYIVTFFGLVL